jgi:hypothetical protein
MSDSVYSDFLEAARRESELFIYCQRVIPVLEETCEKVDAYIDQLL